MINKRQIVQRQLTQQDSWIIGWIEAEVAAIQRVDVDQPRSVVATGKLLAKPEAGG